MNSSGIIAVIAAIVFWTPSVIAQSYPSKPIQMILSTTPGAGTDLMGRTLAERLGERMGPIVVINNGAAAGLVAAQLAKRAAPDGYTLLFTNDNLVLMQALGASADIDVVRDFEPIVLGGSNDFYLVVTGEAMAASTALDLVRMTKEKPGKFSYATPGVGAPHHLGMELFKQRTGADILHVPFKGMGPALPDLLAGRVQVTMTGLPAVDAYVSSGKIKLLAVAAQARSADHPNIPTLREAGVPNVEIQGYNYLVAPLGTPPPILARLNSEINEILKSPQVRADLARRGTMPAGGTAAELRKKLQTETEKWTQVVKTAGIRPE